MPLSNMLGLHIGVMLGFYGDNGKVNGNYYHGAIGSTLFTPALRSERLVWILQGLYS